MKPRVLIFDDNDIFRSTLEYALQKRGYEIFTFPDPGMYRVSDSVNHDCRLDHACADIIISDVNMPTETGLEFIQNRIKQGCKVQYRALISGDWTDFDLQIAQELGCRVFHKPFISEMLLWLDDCRGLLTPERKLSDLFQNRT